MAGIAPQGSELSSIVLGNVAVKSCGPVLALLTLAIMSYGDSAAGVAAASRCTLDFILLPDGTPTLTGDRLRDAGGIAAAIARAHDTLEAAGDIALGRTTFGSVGVFDRCAVMARLADDPRWTASIDSRRAGGPLHDALKADVLAPSIAAALAKAGRKLRGVSVETVLLSEGPAEDCPKSPARAPIEARMWLLLE